jgi:hypothetical protein
LRDARLEGFQAVSATAPVSSLPVSDAPAYVPPATPPLVLYQDKADIDVVYLVEITPFVPSAST